MLNDSASILPPTRRLPDADADVLMLQLVLIERRSTARQIVSKLTEFVCPSSNGERRSD